jgi:hypothetical protein
LGILLPFSGAALAQSPLGRVNGRVVRKSEAYYLANFYLLDGGGARAA